MCRHLIEIQEQRQLFLKQAQQEAVLVGKDTDGVEWYDFFRLPKEVASIIVKIFEFYHHKWIF